MRFQFAEPQFLWMLAVALPLLGVFFFWSWRVQQRLTRQFVPARLRATLTEGVSSGRRKLRLALLAAAVAGALAALARPQGGFVWEETRQQGLDILVAVDTSRSMLAPDVPPNRLERAKLAAFDLLRQAKDDRLGLIAFAGTAFLQCPLTLDDEAFRQSVDELKVGIVPQGGTALAEVIHTALHSFETGDDNHKVLVLFTDGEDHDADAETLGAADEAAKAGLRIFTVGVGTAAGELLRVTDDQGNQTFVKDEDGNVVKSHLNEPLLEKIATAAGGFYLPLRGADPMDVLYSRGLAPLPKGEGTAKLTRVLREQYQWPLGLAVLCLALELVLSERESARRARGRVARPGAGWRKAAAIFCLLLVPGPARASTPGAFHKYQAGDYEGAYEEYSRLAAEKTNDYRLHYDAGTAAYRAKQLEAAEKQLGAALNSPAIATDLETQERTYFNLGNTLYQLGEPAPEPDQKKERWEQAVANYARALQLKTNDVDARNNLAFVKKKLEELKQQQQQQKQQQQQQKNQKDQKDQKGQKGGKDQKDQKSGQQDQKDKNDQKDQQQAEKSDQDKQNAGQKQQAAQGEKDKKPQNKSDQAKAAGEDQRDKTGDQNQEGVSAAPAAMTPQQAQQLLDAQKDDEKALIFSPQNQPVKTANGKIKDW